MKKFLSLLAGIILAAGVPNARATTDSLNLGAGARAAGMGGAFAALADDATALYWNPGALTQVPSRDASFTHAPYYESSFYDHGAYAQNLGSGGAWGAGLQYFSAGPIDRSANNQNLGSFTPYDLSISLGYAHTFLDFSWGVAAKFIQSKILDTASAEAVDLGVLSPGYLQQRLRFAFTVANLGTALKFDQASEPLPRNFRLSGAYRFSARWVTSLDVISPREGGPDGAFGTEYTLPALKDWRFSLRGGYNTHDATSGESLSGAALGFGVKKDQMRFDYACSPASTLGFRQYVSMGFTWGQSRTAAPARTPPKRPSAKTRPLPEILTSAENLIKWKEISSAKRELDLAYHALAPKDPQIHRYYKLQGDVALAQGDIKRAKAFYRAVLRGAKKGAPEDKYTTGARAALRQCQALEK